MQWKEKRGKWGKAKKEMHRGGKNAFNEPRVGNMLIPVTKCSQTA